jgi:hypothetical protein
VSAVTVDELYERFAGAIRTAALDAVADAVRLTPAGLRKALTRRLTDGYRDLASGAGHEVHLALEVARAGVAESPREAARSIDGAALYARIAGVAEPQELLFTLVAGRGRTWLAALASALVRSPRYGPSLCWHLAHTLVRRDLAERPAAPEYVQLVLRSYPWADIPLEAEKDDQLAGLVDELLRTPGVGHVIGRWDWSFVPEGPVTDEFREKLRLGRERGWQQLLAIVGGDDAVRRPGVIDDCLAGLAGGLPVADAPGLAAILGRLSVTLDEAAARQARYAALLLSDAPTAVRAASDQLPRLLEAGFLEADTILDVTPDVFARKEKVRVRAHVSLVRDAVTAGVVDGGTAARLLADAIDPARTDLAEEAARLVVRWAKDLAPEDLTAVRVRLAQAVPEPWPALRRALGPLATEQSLAVAQDLRASAPVDLPEPGRVEPVASLDELMVLLEEELIVRPTAIAVERALDGMNRFRDPGELFGVARLERLVAPMGRSQLNRDVELVIRAWCGEKVSGLRPGGVRRGWTYAEADVPVGAVIDHRSPDGVVRWHQDVPIWRPAYLVHRRISLVRLPHFASRPAPLLSLPTAEDGTIDAEAFIDRAHRRAAAGLRAEAHDLGTALLRIRPEDRATLAASGVLQPETADLLALLDREPRWTWTTVEEPQYNGRRLDRPVQRWLDPEAPVGSMDDPVRAWLDCSTVVSQRGDRMEDDGWHRPLPRHVDMWALTLPSHPNLLAAHVQGGWGWAMPSVLATSRSPWGPPVATLVVNLMRDDEAETRLRVAEVLARAAGHGFLVSHVLGDAMRLLLHPETRSHVKDGLGHETRPNLNRVAGVLADAARIDDRAARLILDTLVPELPWLLAEKGGQEFVGLAAATAERLRVRVTAPPEVVALAESRSASRTAAEARRLVAAGV